MKEIVYKTNGTCAKTIRLQIDEDGKVHNLIFEGGCPGNLKAISKLCEGMDAKRVAELLEGNICGAKTTSCTDQLSKAIKENL